MRTLIVDDEPLARQRLERLLEKLGKDVVGQAANGQQALEMIDQLNPDVVLLDVQMPIMDGFETARHINSLQASPAIIFCTAYDQYALNAFDAAAVDYLVKPVKLERLQKAYEKLIHFRPASPPELPSEGVRNHLCTRIGNKLSLIPIDNIFFCRAEHKYITVVHRDGESLVEEALVALEQEFHDRLVRIHRNTLVSRDQILALEKHNDQSMMLRLKQCDRLLDVSRRNLPQIRKLIKSI